jgi:quercetin dioxygenase-like cupin family protein
MNRNNFERKLREQGYSEPRTIEYQPNSTSEMHTHDFSCLVLVVDGEFTLAKETGSEKYAPGDTCSLDAGTLHAEQAGASGARILVGTKD